MNKKYYALILALLCLIAIGSYYLLYMGNNKEIVNITEEGYTSINTENLAQNLPQASTTLTDSEKEDLLYMREEEKLARDAYITLYEKWGIPIFNNISNSEQTHTDSIKVLIDRYNLTDSALNEVGKFTNQELQSLYDALILKGSVSLEEALVVGASIEEIDILDLEDAIGNTNKEDIQTVYGNLMKGSRNHLRSFVKNMDSRGYSYTPQYLPQEDFDEIVNSQIERGKN